MRILSHLALLPPIAVLSCSTAAPTRACPSIGQIVTLEVRVDGKLASCADVGTLSVRTGSVEGSSTKYETFNEECTEGGNALLQGYSPADLYEIRSERYGSVTYRTKRDDCGLVEEPMPLVVEFKMDAGAL